MSYDLRTAARRAVNDLRARAELARRSAEDHLAVFLELQASRLEAPLALEERAAQARDAAAMERLHRGEQ